jgi:proline iminopeptidase
MPRSQEASYAYILEKARAANDGKTVRELQSIGPPPFDSMDKIVAYFQMLEPYEWESDRTRPGGVLTAPNYSLKDIYSLIKGFARVPTFQIYHEMLSANLSSLGTDFHTPIFFFQGAEDERTPASLSRDYFDKINAPHKEFVLFEHGGHFVALSMPDRFMRELIDRVRPQAGQADEF